MKLETFVEVSQLPILSAIQCRVLVTLRLTLTVGRGTLPSNTELGAKGTGRFPLPSNTRDTDRKRTLVFCRPPTIVGF